MTIDDELLLALIKPDHYGGVGDKALILKIVGTRLMKYQLEEPTDYRTHGDAVKGTITEISPDITVSGIQGQSQPIAIELENDIAWDFGESLRQVKKYKRKFADTRVIIPEDYRRFAPLYKKEGFRVYLWKAERRWQCLRCGTETVRKGPITPKCSNSDCDNHNPNEFRLIGLKDADVQEYT